VFKIFITDLDELKQRTESAKLHHIVIVSAFHQWRHRQIQSSDACFVHILSQYC